jgi:hypothetical protein
MLDNRIDLKLIFRDIRNKIHFQGYSQQNPFFRYFSNKLNFLGILATIFFRDVRNKLHFFQGCSQAPDRPISRLEADPAAAELLHGPRQVLHGRQRQPVALPLRRVASGMI